MGAVPTTGPGWRISENDVREYRQRGYWISPKILTDGQIARLNRAHERIWNGEIDGDGFYYEGKPPQVERSSPAIRKVQNGWWINDEVRSLALSSLIGGIAAALMECRAARLWHDQVIEKPGAGAASATLEGNVGWHQDYAYWQVTDTTDLVSAWVALQDTDLGNGAMLTLTGSHRWGLLPDSASFREPDMAALRRQFESQVRPWIEEPCILKAGQVSFHHALCMHGSGPNATDRPRRCVTVHVMPDGTAYRRHFHNRTPAYHSNVRLLGPRPREGQRFDNYYFPLLNDEAYEQEAARG